MRAVVEPITEHLNLLAADEPPPWEILSEDSPSPLVILCDHARNRIPRRLGRMGLAEEHFETHIAYDIGAEKVTRELCESLGCCALLSGYSRLVIDPNRHPGDGSSIPEISDEVEIPANHALTPEQILEREQSLFWPYHNRVTKKLEQISQRGQLPVIIAIHSFTPVFRGFQRPWHIGVLWDRDQRVSRPLIQRLRGNPDLRVGDNEPYHARNPVGFTMEIHCEHNGFPHALLEIRQDLIKDDAGARHWAALIQRNLKAVLEEAELLPQSG
jgi:predicted N-formylglutamate amidohydrolase